MVWEERLPTKSLFGFIGSGLLNKTKRGGLLRQDH
jgi:hypothetical protein